MAAFSGSGIIIRLRKSCRFVSFVETRFLSLKSARSQQGDTLERGRSRGVHNLGEITTKTGLSRGACRFDRDGDVPYGTEVSEDGILPIAQKLDISGVCALGTYGV